MMLALTIVVGALTIAASTQHIIQDSVKHGPAIEVVFEYNTQWPTGIPFKSCIYESDD